jgi:predicted RNase H-like nuclease (RuvC/YqgF family)
MIVFVKMNQQTTNTTEISEVETLNRMLEKQKQEILRLNKKFEKTNKIWELKMAVMKKNFHALKNEFHLRHQLERQSIQLHHATVGYASSGNSNTLQEHATEEKALVPKLKSRPCTSSNEQSTTMPATPLDVCRVSLNAPPSQGGRFVWY